MHGTRRSTIQKFTVNFIQLFKVADFPICYQDLILFELFKQ